MHNVKDPVQLTIVKSLLSAYALFAVMSLACLPACAQQVTHPLDAGVSAQAGTAGRLEEVIIDTDIGDDVDDAFAIGLAFRSPEIKVLGITTTFGDTQTRAKLLDRMLGAIGRQDVPVAEGSPSLTSNTFTQKPYAEAGDFARKVHPSAVDFMAEQIKLHPGQITLIAIGPLNNLGALIDQQPTTFRELKRVVLMGGSIYRGYGDFAYLPSRGPTPEWNILNDISSVRKVLSSGVAIYVMPLDSTQLHLDEIKRAALFSAGTPLTDQLTLLYHQWGAQTPTLFDVMTVAFILNSSICPVQSMRLRVDEKGSTLVEAGPPNARVCLRSDEDSFFRLLLDRLIQ